MSFESDRLYSKLPQRGYFRDKAQVMQHLTQRDPLKNFSDDSFGVNKFETTSGEATGIEAVPLGGMMNSPEAISVPVRIGESIVEEIEEMYDRITRRAYEIFRERGGNSSLDLEDWLAAERELVFKPAVQVEETNLRITVTVCIGKIRPLDVHLLVTPEAMVIQAEQNSAAKKVFRTVQFPRRIDVRKAEARYADGCLILTA